MAFIQKKDTFLRNGWVFFLIVCLWGNVFLMNKCVPWGMVVFFKEYGHVFQGNVFVLRTNVLNYPSGLCSLAKQKDWQCPWPFFAGPSSFNISPSVV
jgi:hypothetical protein